MGFFNRLWNRSPQQSSLAPPREIAVGAAKDDVSITFNNRNITYTGDLASYDYDTILRDKQTNIVSLFQLSDYYVDADPLYRGIIKEVYTPFSIADDFRLVGANEKVKKKYLDYYDRIHLKDKMRSIFLQYYKYGNVYVYLMEDGSLITLPVHMIRIANVMVDGEPVLEFNCRTITQDLKREGIKAKKDYLDDELLDVRLRGFPKEVQTAVKEGKEYVQLNPANTFVLQDLKEDWVRYAVPMVATCLRAFSKKEVISQYEDSLLNLGAMAFLHVKYGDPKNEVIPTVDALRQVSNIFKSAMTGTALAVTNNWCAAEVIQPKMDDMFEYDKYKGVNAEILNAGGISGVIVSGRSEDGSTFASAQVSMKTAAMRIRQAKDSFCEMMNKINRRLNGAGGAASIPHSAESSIPLFTFPPVDLSGDKDFREACMKLWEKGVVSDKTLLQTYGYDYDQEVERKKTEDSNGNAQVLMPKKEADVDSGAENNTAPNAESDEPLIEGKVGRPEVDESERTSDPANAITGKQPKPSTDG